MLRSSLRLLEARDAGAVLALCALDPVANVFVASRVQAVGCDPSRLGGELWGWYEWGKLRSLCWSGANLMPVQATPAAREGFAARALRQGRRCSSIVGPADSVLDLWRLLEPRWGPARDVRAKQPLMVVDSQPGVLADPEVRRTLPTDLDVLVPACVAMFTEEVGYSPAGSDGGALYRARVAELVDARHSFARIEESTVAGQAAVPGQEGRRVIFKAELGAVSPDAAQVQGVWVDPERRGQGLSVPGMAAVVSATLRDVAPLVSLYVNEYNARAVAAYRRVGFREIGTFATVLF